MDPAGSGACTVTADVPLWPSLIAVIVAVPPSARSVTSPVRDTVMTVGALDAHATARPVSVVPLASLSVTLSWVVPWSGSIAGAGLTTTDATGTSVTVTVALPVFPSLVAVIVAVPAATPLTSPLLLTVAILVLLLAHVTVRPVSAVPAESFGLAVSCAVCPTVRLAVAGATATAATGTAVTVIAAVLLLPSLVAVMVVAPAATPVTRPLGFTRTSVVSPLAQVTVRPAKVAPAESFGVAVSCTVCPTRMLAVAGEIATEATGTVVMVIAAVLLLPSLIAVIGAEPEATPVTRPPVLTRATVVSPLAHVTVRPTRVPPAESFGVAVSCTVCPTRMLAVAGETTTEATGTSVTVTAALPVLPSLVAVIVTVPTAPLVTSPLALTVATPVLLLVHVTDRPVNAPPAESFGVAANCSVCPTLRLPVAGETTTEATGTVVTVIAAVLLLPSLIAVIGAEPEATPVTRPPGLTRATVVSPLAHVTVRPTRVPPAESFGVAVSCTVCPTRMLAVAGETVTEATVAGVLGAGGASSPTTGTEMPITRLATAITSAMSMRPFGFCGSAGVTPGRQVVAGSHGGMPVAAAPPFTGRTLPSRKGCAASVAPEDARLRSRTSHRLISPTRLASPNRYAPVGPAPATRSGARGATPHTRPPSGATASSTVPRTPSAYPFAMTVKTNVTPVGARPCGLVARTLRLP